MTTAEDRVEKIKAFYRAVDSHDIEGILSHTTDNVVFDSIGFGKVARGRQEVADLYRVFFKGFPDLDHDFNPIPSVSGEIVFVEGIVTGTMQGEFAGHKPTGRRLRARFLTVFEFHGDQIQQLRPYYDNQSWMAQILGED